MTQPLSQWARNEQLAKAARDGDLAAVKAAIAKGAEVQHDKHVALRNAASYTDNADLVRFLLEQGADHTVMEGAPLRIAAEEGHLEVVKMLHGFGADLRAGGDYALRYAVVSNRLNVVKYLLDNGVDPHTCKDLPLGDAAYCGHPKIVDCLLAHMFRQELWQGKTAADVDYEAARLAELIMRHVSWGSDNKPISKKNAAAAVELIYTHAMPLFHALRHEVLRANPVKPLPPITARPL